MFARNPTPLELYNKYKRIINLNCGYVHVTFMQEDPATGALVRDGLTGREYLNDEAARDLGGSATKFGFLQKLLSQSVRSFTSNFSFTHVELAFPLSEVGARENGEDKLLAVFVSRSDNVGIRLRRFDERYKWFAVSTTSQQMCSMLKFACLTYGEKFSLKMLHNTVTSPGKENQPGWYCSKHVATMLRSLDCAMFHMNRTNTITVDELYHMVECCGHIAPASHVRKPVVVLEKIYGKQQVEDYMRDQRGEKTLAASAKTR